MNLSVALVRLYLRLKESQEEEMFPCISAMQHLTKVAVSNHIISYDGVFAAFRGQMFNKPTKKS